MPPGDTRARRFQQELAAAMLVLIILFIRVQGSGGMYFPDFVKLCAVTAGLRAGDSQSRSLKKMTEIGGRLEQQHEKLHELPFTSRCKGRCP